jgi:hypothetical protein
MGRLEAGGFRSRVSLLIDSIEAESVNGAFEAESVSFGGGSRSGEQ